MSGPKSFRELLPVKRAPKPKAPTPVSKGGILTPQYIEEQNTKKKEMVEFANSLRCALCLNQLDGGAFSNRASLYCRAEPQHYKCEYNAAQILTYCAFNLSFDQNGYTLECSKNADDLFNIHVYQIDRTMTSEFQERSRKEMFHYVGLVPELECDMLEHELMEQLRFLAMFS